MAARGLAGLPLTVILLAGQGRDPAGLQLGPLASNVVLHAHAPLSDLLPLADALVTNGNSESVLAALQVGLPVVVQPSIWDQAEMAWRVAETGTGLRIPTWRASPGRMRRAVLRVLREPSFGHNSVIMGAALARRGGPARAAGLIDELIGCRQRAGAL
jgi:UDP:flavonoid glycosyltransferase YjiC (YdhE family)